jgi:hypothetical protein
MSNYPPPPIVGPLSPTLSSVTVDTTGPGINLWDRSQCPSRRYVPPFNLVIALPGWTTGPAWPIRT